MSASLSCPACGGAFGAPAPYPGAHDHASTLTFEAIVACGRCGLGMALPRYSQPELDAFYAHGAYWDATVGRSRTQALHERNQSRHRVARASQALPPDARLRVLDVGAGHGWTAYWLGCGHRSVGTFDFVEPDERCSGEILARPTRFPVRRIASLEKADGEYDLVFLNHVLEHVADPVQCVSSVARLLSPYGVAYFEMPYADQRFKRDVFPHTWFFTPAALQALARVTRVQERQREAFGRMPSSGISDLVLRAGYRAAAALGWSGLAARFDDGVWRYAAAGEGIWLRWIVSRAPD